MKKDYAPESSEESLGASREAHDYYAQRARRWRNRVGLGVLAVVLLFWAYTLFATPFFAVQSIAVTGMERIQKEEIQNRIRDFLGKRQWGIVPFHSNIFLLRTDRLIAHFRSDARIATMTVQKNYPSRALTVTLAERVPIYILALPDRAFAIDKEGIALIPLSVPPPQGSLPIITDIRQRDVALGQRVIDEKELKLLVTFRDEAMRLVFFTRVTIGEPSPDAITLATEEGWGVYVSAADSPAAQLERLRVLLATKIKPERRKKLQYIDLRFGERVYYK